MYNVLNWFIQIITIEHKILTLNFILKNISQTVDQYCRNTIQTYL